MPRFPDDLRAERGRAIQPAWEGLEAWVDGYPTPGSAPGVRVSEFPDQTIYYASRPPSAWGHPFRVRISGTEATVALGLVNLTVPRMGEDLLSLDGLDTGGEDAGEYPVLEVLGQRAGGPDPATGTSWIALRVAVTTATGKPDTESDDWLTVVHRPRLPVGFASGGMPERLEGQQTAGYWPVAKLYWQPDGTAVRNWFQVCHHNQQHRWQRGAEDPARAGGHRPGRHWFFGAG